MPPDYVELEIEGIERPVRRGQVKLILDILENVPVDDVGNVDQISKSVGARWSTTSKYLELITLIQVAPKLRVFTLKGGHNKLYRRETGTIKRELI